MYEALSLQYYRSLVPEEHQKEFAHIWNKMAELDESFQTRIGRLNRLMFRTESLTEEEQDKCYVNPGMTNELNRAVIAMYDFVVNSRLEARVDQLETITINAELREGEQMEKGLQVFKHTEFGEISILVVDGKELFPATECAKMLGYTNPEKAIRDHCKGVNETFTPSAGGKQKKNFIPEGDLFRLIVKSKLPAAEKFEHWVFDEVLPALRKNGSYSIQKAPEQEPEMLPQAGNDALENAKFVISTIDRFGQMLEGNVAQAYVLKALEMVTGPSALPRPQERTYTATEIGNMAGVNRTKVGAVATSNKLKTEEFGIEISSTSSVTGEQYTAFRYNENGRRKLLELLKAS